MLSRTEGRKQRSLLAQGKPVISELSLCTMAAITAVCQEGYHPVWRRGLTEKSALVAL